jgi:hypothetical protein
MRLRARVIARLAIFSRPNSPLSRNGAALADSQTRFKPPQKIASRLRSWSQHCPTLNSRISTYN